MPAEPPVHDAEPLRGPLAPAAAPESETRRVETQQRAMGELSSAIGSILRRQELVVAIGEAVSAIIRAESASCFVVDRDRAELWSKVVEGPRPVELRMPLGEGIAGWVARSGQSVNLRDAYDDPRFDRGRDQRTGRHTRSVLCVPIHDRASNVVGVLECINRKRPAGLANGFDAEDEELLRGLAVQCALALENAACHEATLEQDELLVAQQDRLQRLNSELELQLEVERQISDATDMQDLLTSTLERACALLRVQAGAVLLVRDGELLLHASRPGADFVPVRTMSQRDGIRVVGRARGPIHRRRDEGGALADSLIADGAALFVEETFSVPLADGRGNIGLIQLVNRLDEGESADWILRVLSLLAAQVARGVVVWREREASERAERLALLGRALGGVLDELRNPLSMVEGLVKALGGDEPASARQNHSAHAVRMLGRVEAMVRETLAFVRGQREVVLQEVQLASFVSDIHEMLLVEAERHEVRLELQVSYDGPARFDVGKLERVIFQLARNACEAMHGGGTLTLVISRQAERLIIECLDTGPGIAKAMRGRLFESFATHGKSEATGIGLAMAKKIVDAHCGTIECLPRAPRGTVFRIELPI